MSARTVPLCPPACVKCGQPASCLVYLGESEDSGLGAHCTACAARALRELDSYKFWGA